MKKISQLLAILLCSCACVFAKQTSVCLVTLHPGPANHFADLTRVLKENGISFEIYAGDNAEKVLREQKVPHKRISIWSKNSSIGTLPQKEIEPIAKLLAHKISSSKLILTDISEDLIVALHNELKALNSKAARFVYYDNPESWVCKDYSDKLKATLEQGVTGVLFANQNLASSQIFCSDKEEIDLSSLKTFGIGFCSTSEIKKLSLLREKKQKIRKKLFSKLKIDDLNQKVLVYLGGASSSYFEEGFPFFLNLLNKNKDHEFFDSSLLLLQQHPRAKMMGNHDEELLNDNSLPLAVSPLTTLESLSISDLTYYFQTSMAPKLLLTNVSLLKVAPEGAQDTCSKESLVSFASSDCDFLTKSQETIGKTLNDEDKERLYQLMGYSSSWDELFLNFISEYIK